LQLHHVAVGYQKGIYDAMSDTAVLVVDMINTYRHPDADKLVRDVETVIDPLARLISHVRGREEVDLIYVNDNYGDFGARHDDLVRSALAGERPDLVKPIVPEEGCRFLVKVRHSAFYSTSLEYLLGQLETRTVVLTGQVTEQCILYTALDAYVRHFDLVVPSDAVAAIDVALGEAALKMMEQNMHAKVMSTAEFLR
jgi:nicotinamidase-related amidase